MKNKMPNTTTEVLHKIEIIEDEVADLKVSIAKNIVPSKKNLVSLKGLLKGVTVSETDIQKAQASLYGRIKT